MPPHTPVPSAIVAAVFSMAALASAQADSLLDADDVAIGTRVRFETDAGNLTVGLFDTTTPLTVANFLGYLNDGDYANTFFHRLVDDFIIQGGGFTATETAIDPVPTDAPVANEPLVSNTAGTIAMAKLGGNPDSATSHFFFNLADNSANLDNQNEGFTAFGRVIEGFDDFLLNVADLDIADASAFIGDAFTQLPIEDINDGLNLDNLVSINAIEVLPGVVSMPTPSAAIASLLMAATLLTRRQRRAV